MYRLFKSGGPAGRLFMSGSRQNSDNDKISVHSGSLSKEPDDADLHQVLTHRKLTTETAASGQDSTRVERRGKIKSVTTRIVKKTTTVTRGEQKMVAEAILKSSETQDEDINKTPYTTWRTELIQPVKRAKMHAVCHSGLIIPVMSCFTVCLSVYLLAQGLCGGLNYLVINAPYYQ